MHAAMNGPEAKTCPRGVRNAGQRCPRLAALQSQVFQPDLLLLIMRCHAIAVGGWTEELLRICRVCKAFHEAVLQCRSGLEEWGETSWAVRDWLREPETNGEVVYQQSVERASPEFTCGTALLAWQLRFVRRGGVIGVFLQIPATVRAPQHRTTEALLTVHAPCLEGGRRTHHLLNTYVLPSSSRPRCTTPGQALWGSSTMCTVDELSSSPGADWDGAPAVLRISARVRVLNGPRCLKRASGKLLFRHTLALCNLSLELGYLFPGVATVPWTCDYCGKPHFRMPPAHREQVWHCAVCNFDICLGCWPDDAPHAPQPGVEVPLQSRGKEDE